MCSVNIARWITCGFLAFASLFRTAVARAIKAGASEDAAATEVELPACAHIPRYRDWLPVDVRAVYRYRRGR